MSGTDDLFSWDRDVQCGADWIVLRTAADLPAYGMILQPQHMAEHGDLFAVGARLTIKHTETDIREYEVTEHKDFLAGLFVGLRQVEREPWEGGV